MIRPLCRMGNPILRKDATTLGPQELKSDELKQLIIDMRESMAHYGGIGLAAPQIGVPWQVAIIELSSGQNRYGSNDSLPFTVFINPKLTVLDEQQQGFWEGCLSVPGLRGYVERPRKVKVNYLNEFGGPQELIAENFLATVVQHELDHLWGHLYVDRMKDLRLLSFQEEFNQFYGQVPSLDEDGV